MSDSAQNRSSLKRWEIAGCIATFFILLAIPLDLLKTVHFRRADSPALESPSASFVGSENCTSCHKGEYDKWRGSHHDKAMDVANKETVLGDFDDATFERDGITSRFHRKGSRYYVNTQGPTGSMDDFEITHTFGVYPLQQYLVPFPGGRLQCLPIAWDSKDNRWFRLPGGTDDPEDWLHWTRSAQNWNGMCAESHSTGLKKGYDYKADTYTTTWAEIDVSCEACHGPGSLHVQWAELPPMARPETEGTYDLIVETGNLSSEAQVAICARCHARRSLLNDYDHSKIDMMDNMVPMLLDEGLYHPDGQILEEVYVYGSFTRSKMYLNDIRCGDCHDVHSIKRVNEGNDLCLQCHRADIYDTKDHHFHKKKGEEGEPILSKTGEIISYVGEGAECEKCHMPGQYYMGNDYRLDHSIRIPRPDLSMALETPNACNRCHINKSIKWSVDYITKWYGIKRKPHYGTTLAAGRQ